MFIHYEVVNFLKISRDVFHQGGREYAHCTWKIVLNRLTPIMSTLVKITFSRKFRNFLRLAGFAKNGEKLVFKIGTFFYCYIFILINYCVLESFSQNNPLAVELFPSEVRFDYVNTW
ncbi:hypothetical protein T4A_7 [Trichinella pseudospiralis]|uniref:Uncharacterized protein n=1 Tax=Trichinella pseudospiralis TaxID=6337 RepID=A0A0V1DS74_TRIPS|nr:hypothetical protein T4A_12343 [Trichinella pseudospiralis]KRY64335.1 hypothetical protein T4A_7 [Trichinella pseudospiralis]